MTKPEQPVRDDAPRRKPYNRPRLQRWGNLKELTLGSGGKKTEPGAPSRKSRF